jgi:hypothetical protein
MFKGNQNTSGAVTLIPLNKPKVSPHNVPLFRIML